VGKSSKTAKADRQKRIDDIKRKQKRADARQGMVIIAVAVTIALGIVGAGFWFSIGKTWVHRATISAESLSDLGSGPEVCGEVELSPQEGNQHLDQGVQARYTVAPPATGDHWNVARIAPAPIAKRFYSERDRPELEALVHNSEHGYTMLWYDDTVSNRDVAVIQTMADFLSASDTNFRYKFKAVPWTEEDAERVAESRDLAVRSAEQAVEFAQAAVTEAGDDEEAAEAAQLELEAAQEALAEAEQLAEEGGGFPDDASIAFTHWTAEGQAVHQYCTAPSGEALWEFMLDYPFTDSPEPYAP
jgi:hypothetical protein